MNVLGHDITDLPEGWLPADVLVIVKCVTPSGAVGWVTRATDGMNTAETVAALRVEETLQLGRDTP